jgi:serine/threonine-protein kinase HipA
LSLDVYLNAKRIGSLDPGGGSEYSFAYAPELVEETAEGAPLLSYLLPVRAEPYGPAETRPYIEGLLPEGERREEIASRLGVDPLDGYALIAELGHDCPGAAVFLPRGMVPEPCDPDSLTWLDEDELEELVDGEPDWLSDPDCEERIRFALPGERHKLALIRDEQEDRWAWPEAGAPSTHIVKPVDEDCADFAVNEVACTMAVREMGLPVAHAEVETIAGRPCLVSKRFDRWGEGADVERLHQESFAQALGYLPDDLEGKGPGYAESRELLRAIGEEESIRSLFTVSYCRFLIGCRDEVHGKNSGLLYTAAGPMLAPFYDISSTSVYEDPTELLTLEEVVHRNSCMVGLAQVAIECEYQLEDSVLMAIRTIAALSSAVNSVADRAKAEGWYEPVIDEVLQRVFDCAKSFREEVEMLKPPSLGGPGMDLS